MSVESQSSKTLVESLENIMGECQGKHAAQMKKMMASFDSLETELQRIMDDINKLDVDEPSTKPTQPAVTCIDPTAKTQNKEDENTNNKEERIDKDERIDSDRDSKKREGDKVDKSSVEQP